MSKENKVIKGAAVVAVASLATALHTPNVSAEEITTTQPTQPAENTANPTTEATKVKEVPGVIVTNGTAVVTETPTAEVVSQAKDIQTEATEAVNQQQAVVDQAQENHDNSKAILTEATEDLKEAEQIKEVATPEEIADTEGQIQDVSGQIEAKETQAQEAKEATANAEAERNSQKEVVDQSTQAVNKQQDVVNDAKKDVDTAQAALDGTGAAKVIAERDNAQKDALDKKAKEAQAKEDLALAQQFDADKDKQIQNLTVTKEAQEKTEADTSKALNTAQTKADETKANREDAQKSVDSAQAALDGTGAAKVIAERDAAQKDAVIKQEAEATAKTELADAKEFDTNKANRIQELTATKVIQSSTANAVAVELGVATSLANDAKTKKDSADTLVKNLEKQIQDIKSMTKITLSNEVIAKWRIHSETFGAGETEAMDNLQDSLDSWWDAEYEKIKFGITTPIDNTIVNPNELSSKQVEILSHYYAFLVNNLRKQVGEDKKMIVTEESVQAVQKIAQNYANENKSWSSGHSDTALENDGVENMFYTTENFASARYGTNTTMTDMFEQVYLNVISFLVYDRQHNFGHLDAMLISRTGHDADLVGMDVSITPNKVVRNHYITFSKRDYNKLQSPFDTTELEKRLVTAKTQQATANTNHANAQARLQRATTANTNAQSALKATTDELSKLQSTADRTPGAQAKLTKATTDREKADDRLTKAQEAVANLNADIQTKTRILEEAKTNLEIAKQAEADAKQKLEEAKKADAKAEKALADTMAKLSTLQSTADRTPGAQAKLTAATTAREKADARLAKAEEAVANLNADIQTKTKALNDAKDALNKEVAKLQELKNQENADKAKLQELEQKVISLKVAEAAIQEDIENLEDEKTLLETYLDKLINADENLEKAISAHQNASLNYTETLKTLEREENLLTQLLSVKRDADAQYNAVKAEFDKAELKKQHDDIVNKGGTPEPILDVNGNIIGYKAKEETIKVPLQASYSRKERYGNKSLPSTGEANTSLSALGILSLLTLGMVGKSKRKREE